MVEGQIPEEIQKFLDDHGFDFNDMRQYNEVIIGVIQKSLLYGETTISVLQQILTYFETLDEKERKIVLCNFTLQSIMYLIQFTDDSSFSSSNPPKDRGLN